VLGGCLYAAGGQLDALSVERYDTTTNTWTAVEDMLDERRSFGAVTIGSPGPAEEQDLFDSLIAKVPSERP
jgi:transcription termination factor Rho